LGISNGEPPLFMERDNEMELSLNQVLFSMLMLCIGGLIGLGAASIFFASRREDEDCYKNIRNLD